MWGFCIPRTNIEITVSRALTSLLNYISSFLVEAFSVNFLFLIEWHSTQNRTTLVIRGPSINKRTLPWPTSGTVHKLRRFDRLQRFASVVVVFVFVLFVHLSNGFLKNRSIQKNGVLQIWRALSKVKLNN